MDFKIIAHENKEYEQMRTLRYQVLRKPLSLSFPEELWQKEKDCLPQGFFNE